MREEKTLYRLSSITVKTRISVQCTFSILLKQKYGHIISKMDLNYWVLVLCRISCWTVYHRPFTDEHLSSVLMLQLVMKRLVLLLYILLGRLIESNASYFTSSQTTNQSETQYLASLHFFVLSKKQEKNKLTAKRWGGRSSYVLILK